MAGLTIWALMVPQAMAYAAIASVHDTLDALGIRVIVARAKSSVRDALRRDGTVDALGEDNLAPSVDRALGAIQADTTSAR